MNENTPTLYWYDGGKCYWCGRQTDSITERHDGVCPIPYAHALEAHVASLQAEVERLRPYLAHRADCAVMPKATRGTNDTPLICTCGLLALLSKEGEA